MANNKPSLFGYDLATSLEINPTINPTRITSKALKLNKEQKKLKFI